ncbi:MerR family transcriptional regulator [Allokutzneria sp. A3M-2-11 16]|uniref:MerR family transcriptional regulator n=1 Tax=Allokutzneria sp. A3M-2-11 16 TaxID=2962043 RepID=UPI0020B8D39C|nr:MerR family transcriptional regulator [Allokutzneria sp. A3M-2-11 16]MCP3803818.1 MerR family transcriptional regulator [Allokutzneria sp. A3M-2-11 16]
MLSIGELADRTGVSVRMLRHYDALGLVVPERVDPATAYRWYSASQVGRVNSLVALKRLGFTLDQCRAALDDQVGAERLTAMLRLRQEELEARIEADSRRLAEVRRRLRAIEEGQAMTDDTLCLGPLPALRLAGLSAEVNDTSEISAMIDHLESRLTAAGPTIRTFYGRPDGSKIEVVVGVRLAPEARPGPGLELVELPGEPRGAIVTHTRSEEDTSDPWLTVDVALGDRGLESYGRYRQIPLGDRVVELHCPVREIGCNAPHSAPRQTSRSSSRE